MLVPKKLMSLSGSRLWRVDAGVDAGENMSGMWPPPAWSRSSQIQKLCWQDFVLRSLGPSTVAARYT